MVDQRIRILAELLGWGSVKPDTSVIGKAGKELCHSRLGDRVDEMWRDGCERDQHESTFNQTGMRQRQILRIKNAIIVEQDIKIYHARPIADASLSAQRTF